MRYRIQKILICLRKYKYTCSFLAEWYLDEAWQLKNICNLWLKQHKPLLAKDRFLPAVLISEHVLSLEHI